MVVLLREGDSDYDWIFDGQWRNDAPYLAIHRLASAGNVAGKTGTIFDWCEKICPNLGIDTHQDNWIMQRVLTKNGFANLRAEGDQTIPERLVMLEAHRLFVVENSKNGPKIFVTLMQKSSIMRQYL